MKRDHLIHLRCTRCRSVLRTQEARTRKGRISSGILFCPSCGYSGSILARIPLLLPEGESAVWQPPFERVAGKHWRTYAESEGWDRLYSKILSDSAVTRSPAPVLSPYQFKRAVFLGSDYYFRKFIQPDEDANPAYDRETAFIVTNVIKSAPRRILEVGAGNGRLLESLLKWRPRTGLLISMDLDFCKLKILEGRIRRLEIDTDAIPVAADARHLPFPENHFDAVITLYGLAYVEGIDRGLEEIRRVLKPGASLWMVEPEMGSDLHTDHGLGDLFLHGLREHFGMHHGKHHIISQLKKLNFEIKKIDYLSTRRRKSFFLEAQTPVVTDHPC